MKAEREKRQALEEAVAVQAQQIAELKPKATYYDVVLKCKDAVNISVIAKDYGWSAQRMNEYLHKKGVQYKQFDILFSQIGISTFTSSICFHYFFLKFKTIFWHKNTDLPIVRFFSLTFGGRFNFTEAKLSFLFMHEFKKRISDLLLLC